MTAAGFKSAPSQSDLSFQGRHESARSLPLHRASNGRGKTLAIQAPSLEHEMKRTRPLRETRRIFPPTDGPQMERFHIFLYFLRFATAKHHLRMTITACRRRRSRKNNLQHHAREGGGRRRSSSSAIALQQVQRTAGPPSPQRPRSGSVTWPSVSAALP
ncbi:unnamed protein product [Lampetra planeri]